VYAETHTLLAEFALSQGDIVTARSLIEKSLAFSRTAGDLLQIPDALLIWGRIAAAQGDDAAAQALYEESLALAREMGFKRKFPACLEALADVVSAQGALVWAARLWGAAEARRNAMGTLIPPVHRADYERSVAATRAQLGEKTFAAAWAEGRDMTPEQVLVARGPVTIPAPAPSSTLQAKSAPTYSNDLTAREVEVLRLLAQGLTDAQIADQLVISPRTVNTHLTAIYGKIQVSSRSAATRYAIEHQLA